MREIFFFLTISCFFFFFFKKFERWSFKIANHEIRPEKIIGESWPPPKPCEVNVLKMVKKWKIKPPSSWVTKLSGSEVCLSVLGVYPLLYLNTGDGGAGGGGAVQRGTQICSSVFLKKPLTLFLILCNFCSDIPAFSYCAVCGVWLLPGLNSGAFNPWERKGETETNVLQLHNSNCYLAFSLQLKWNFYWNPI